LLLRASASFFFHKQQDRGTTVMSTRFYITVAAGSELAETLAPLVSDTRKREHGRPNVDGYLLKYDDDTESWYFETQALVLELTPDLAVLSTNRTDFVIDRLKIIKGRAVVDDKAAYQGKYIGAGNFEGCEASVDTQVTSDGPAQLITVSGPIGLCGDYYAGIRQRRVRPTIWLEPRPSWWRRLLGLA
jgi:hypothetical protein